MEILNTSDFLDNGILTEKSFYEKVDNFDWDSFAGKRVLVRGCGTTAIPPWAFMVIASRLTEVAKVIKYGSEHDAFPVYRNRTREASNVKHAE